MTNLNIIILGGNLTKDPEFRTTQGGMGVVSFSIAVNRTWVDRQSGQKKEETSYVDCEAWGKTAESVNQFLKKGRGCVVEGRVKQDRWETQDGQKRSKLKVVAERVQFMGGREEGQRHEQQQQPAGAAQGGNNGGYTADGPEPF